MIFSDRQDAGEKLAEKLTEGEVVVAIPRGGVVVGKAVADELKLPLSVVVTKKVGAPGQEELAIGAMDADGRVIWDRDLMNRLGLREEDLVPQIENAKSKIENYLRKFDKVQPCQKKKVILVDDGVATGATVKATIGWLRRQGVKKIIVAVPVCAKEAYGELKILADEVVCLWVPDEFGAVGQFYESFPQVSDTQVVGILGS